MTAEQAPALDLAEAVARHLAQQDKLQHAMSDAVGRVVARIEMYDEAVAYDGPDRSQALQEVLKRCRDLKAAVEAHRAFLLGSSASTEPVR